MRIHTHPNLSDPLPSLFDKFFSEFFSASPNPDENNRRRHQAPINIGESDTAVTFELELPGVEESALDVEVLGNQLTITAERRLDTEPIEYHTVEHRYGTISRRIELPRGLDTQSIDATFRNGVLILVVPKVEPATARKITIRTEGSTPAD